MNRSTKLKPLAPRPVIDQGCHQIMSYPCPSLAADARNGLINRHAFVGANLGVHASPLEAVTSMDPKDYVWGGGHGMPFYGCQPSACVPGSGYYYPQEYPLHTGYAQQFPPITGMPAASQPCASTTNCLPYLGGAPQASSKADVNCQANGLCDAQSSGHQEREVSGTLDSKVNDLLGLDDADLKRVLSHNIDEGPEAEDCGSCKKVRSLEPVASGDSNMSGTDEVILPDFGEGFANSEAVLLDIRMDASPLSDSSHMDEANPYLTPLLDPPTPPTCPTAVSVLGKATPDAIIGTDRQCEEDSKETVKQMLSDMSMENAVRCITHFLRCDKRIAKDKRQAATTAVEALCPKKGLVVTLYPPAPPLPTVRPQLKRKRSSSKALEAARNA